MNKSKINRVNTIKWGVLLFTITVYVYFASPKILIDQVDAQTDYQKKVRPERFDDLVRDDFFAGMTGNLERLNRGMKYCEDILSRNPTHPQALVWHGGGLMALAAQSYRKGETREGDAMWEQGIREMNDAVLLAPQSIDVKIGRSATLIGLAQAGWDNSPASIRLLKTALLDYERVYEIQKPIFHQLRPHSRGELLFGLASGWSILGDHGKARHYLGLVISEVGGSEYEKEARDWLKKDPTVIQHDCRGCHIR